MNNIIPFNFKKSPIRVVQDDSGEPLFVVKDVMSALGYSIDGGISKYIKHVPDEWKGGTPISTPGGTQEMAVLTEQGLYFFVSRSDKEAAIPFQKWIAGDVIPSIRKTGTYTYTDQQYTIPKTLPEALRLAAEAIEERDKLKPKADALDRIATSDGSLCVTNAAKDLQIRPKDLFAWLSSNKWIYRRPGGAGWIAYQDKIQNSCLEHKVTVIARSDGSEKTTEQVRITSKGLAKIATMLKKGVGQNRGEKGE